MFDLRFIFFRRELVEIMANYYQRNLQKIRNPTLVPTLLPAQEVESRLCTRLILELSTPRQNLGR